jgi:RNA polymerase sigma-70 factor (ECF subfamily)
MKDQDAQERWARLARLLTPFHEQALGTARNLCRSTADGDDLYQEAVLRAHRKLDTLREEARFRPWFFAVLLSVHRSRARRAFWKRFVPLQDALAGDRAVAGTAVEARAEEFLSARRAARALARLSPVQREAFVLHELEGFSMEEIAGLQGVSTAAVKSRVLRARERLRRHYRARNASTQRAALSLAHARTTRRAS